MEFSCAGGATKLYSREQNELLKNRKRDRLTALLIDFRVLRDICMSKCGGAGSVVSHLQSAEQTYQKRVSRYEQKRVCVQCALR